MTPRKTLSTLKSVGLLCLGLLLGTTIQAAEFVQTVSREGTQIGLTQGYNSGSPQTWVYTPYTIYDQFFQTYTPSNALQDIYITGMLKLNHKERMAYNYSWRLEVTYSIKLYNSANTLVQTLSGEKMSITYFKNANYEDYAQKIYRSGTNYHKAVVSITEIKTTAYNDDGSVNTQGTPSSLGAMFNDVSFDWQCTSVRSFQFNEEEQPKIIHLANGQTINATPVCTDNAPDNTIRLAWEYMYGAENYDLEWIFLDMPPTAVEYSGITYPEIDDDMDFDWRNATRVNVTGNFYDIPLLYPTGIVIYRVRGVGVDISNNFTRLEGRWSHISPSGHRYEDNLGNVSGDKFVYCGMEKSQNWTASLTFAEEGKRKGVVAFVDGTGKTRQTITTINTDQNTVVAESALDNMGRPAVSFLPVPVRGERYGYFPDFNSAFDASEFDVPAAFSDVQPVPGISVVSKSNEYYSVNNPLLGGVSQIPYDNYLSSLAYFIPNAESYPFTQTRLLNDGSGRPHSASGVGGNHMLGGGHDTRYIYGSPGSQAELDRLFGSEAGFVSYYKKNMVTDPNGQVSISYLDGYGRTVATALAGTNTEDMLDPVSEPPAPIVGSLLGSNTPMPNGSLVATKDITVAVDNTVHSLSYSLNPADYETLCLGTYDCKFEFLITLKNAEGEPATPTNMGGNYDPYTWLDASTTTFPYVLDFTLAKGKYTITKTLRIKQAAYLEVLEAVETSIGPDWQNANSCFVPPFQTACFDCDQQCENAHKYTFEYLGQTYWIYRNPGTGADYTNNVTLAALTDDWGNPLFQMPGNITTIMSDAEADIAECKILCDAIPTLNTGSECEMKRILLLKDVLPYGQYFDNRPMNPDVLGEDNTDYLTGSETNPANRNAWLSAYAGDLLDDFNALLNPAAPSNTSWEYIRAHWDEIDETDPAFAALKEQLIQLHPEYCHWTAFCEGKDEPCMCNGLPTEMSPKEYNDLINSIHTDQEAVDHFLFIPHSNQPVYWNGTSAVLASEYVPTGVSIDWDKNCYGDPILMNCNNNGSDHLSQMRERLVNFMEVDLVTSGAATISVWYIITDPENLHLYDLVGSGPHPVYLESFVQYMQVLHGSPSNPQGLLAPFNTTPLAGQMSRWQYFRSQYAALRAQFETQMAVNAISDCIGSSPLINSLNACVGNPNPEGVTCSKVPYMSAWDYDDDGFVDNNDMPDGFSFHGMQIRFPYLPLLNTPGNVPVTSPEQQTEQLGTDYCNTNCSALATQWISQLQNGIRACVSVTGTSTVPFVLTDGDKQILRSYFVSICQASCSTQVAPGGTFTNNFMEAPGIDLSGHAWGGNYDGNTITNVNQVVGLAQQQIGNMMGCPILINTTPAPNTPPINTEDFACSCNKLAEFIYDNMGLNNGYGLVNPLKWETVTSSPSDVFNFGNIETALAEINYNTGGNTQDIVLHWLDQCNTNDHASIPAWGGVGAMITYEFPHYFECTQPTEGFEELGELDCAQTEQEQESNVNSLAFHQFSEEQREGFEANYAPACMEAARTLETFTMSYTLNEYHYTLYYYDQAGNLIKTVPPSGVAIISDQQQLEDIEAFRIAHHHEEDYADQTGFVHPLHDKITNYIYNGQNQVVEQSTPDGGVTRFYYDGLGRLVLSQNAKQAEMPAFSYTLFDAIGRIVEVGEIPLGYDGTNRLLTQLEVQKFVQSGSVLTPFELAVEAYEVEKTQITITAYDRAVMEDLGVPVGAFPQDNLRNRVASSFYYAIYPSDGNFNYYDNATHYSYDIHGNVKRLAQDMPVLQYAKRRFLFTDYAYDLVSGKVNEVHYMKGFPEQLSHYYRYDADNRITAAFTSKNGGLIKELEAKYFYYPTSPLARVELGRAQVQGMDYAYSIHGWLKGVNTDELNTLADIGKDGRLDDNNLHAFFGVDAAGFSLGYYKGDYNPVGGGVVPFEAYMGETDPMAAAMHPNISGLGGNWGLYNGNISKMVTAQLDCEETPMEVLGRSFRYDQLNRITASTAFVRTNSPLLQTGLSPFSWSGINPSPKWATEYTYNPDGDILTLNRTGDNGQMDVLDYQYKNGGVGTHQLDYLKDDIGLTAAYPDDIDNQSPNNYRYDAIGNLTRDASESIRLITWNVYGKVKSVERSQFSPKTNQWFGYNPGGQRIVKINKAIDPANPEEGYSVTFYALDAQGNIMALYEYKPGEGDYTLTCTDQMIYGTSRIGMLHRDVKICDGCVVPMEVENSVNVGVNNQSYIPQGLQPMPSYQKAALGTREYEVSNHLGNVLTTVADRKVYQSGDITAGSPYGTVFQFRPEVLTSGEYYPFGSKLPGRGCSMPVLCTTTSTITEEWVFIDDIFQHLQPLPGTTGTVTGLTCSGNPCAEVRTYDEEDGAEFGFSLNAGYHEAEFDVETTSRTGDAEVRIVVLAYNAGTAKYSDEVAEFINPPADPQTLSFVAPAANNYKIVLMQRGLGTSTTLWHGFRVKVVSEVFNTECESATSTATAQVLNQTFTDACTQQFQQTFTHTGTNIFTDNFGSPSYDATRYSAQGTCTITSGSTLAVSTTNSGDGLKVRVTTVAGQSYALGFLFTKTGNTTSARIYTSGGTEIHRADNGQLIYIFKAQGSTTDIFVLPEGGAVKSMTIDDVTFAQLNGNDYSAFTNSGTISRLEATMASPYLLIHTATNGNGTKVSLQTQAGKTYVVSFDYTHSVNVTDVTVQVPGTAPLVLTASSGVATYTFTATSSQTDLTVLMAGSAGTKGVSIDNFALCEYDGNYTGFVPQGTLSTPLTFSGGVLTATTTATSGAGFKYTLPTIVGEAYTVKFDFTKGGSTSNATVQATGGTTQTISSNGLVTYTFTATGTSTEFKWLITGSGSTAKTITVDNLLVTYEYEAAVVFGGYRFGFNGQEKNNELYGEGNAYDFEYRIHDSRIGRFLSVDPLSAEYPWNSNYAFAENDVIRCKDLEGAEKDIAIYAIFNDKPVLVKVITLQKPGPLGDGVLNIVKSVSGYPFVASYNFSYFENGSSTPAFITEFDVKSDYEKQLDEQYVEDSRSMAIDNAWKEGDLEHFLQAVNTKLTGQSGGGDPGYTSKSEQDRCVKVGLGTVATVSGILTVASAPAFFTWQTLAGGIAIGNGADDMLSDSEGNSLSQTFVTSQEAKDNISRIKTLASFVTFTFGAKNILTSETAFTDLMGMATDAYTLYSQYKAEREKLKAK